MLIFSLKTLAFNAESQPPVVKDSLYLQWLKSKATLPTLIYELKDFNDFTDRVEAESLIRSYGIGGVIIGNGNRVEAKNWINQNQMLRTEPLLHIVEIKNIFELPFDDLTNHPDQLIVECLSDDSLVYHLGKAHANVLRSMGVALVRFADIPESYSLHEIHKVNLYLMGLAAGDISYFKTGAPWESVSDEWNSQSPKQTDIQDVHRLVEGGLLDKNTLKRYRKTNDDRRLIIDQARDFGATINQIERGVDLVLLTKQSEPQELINALLVQEIQNKKCYRQRVKNYFKLINEIDGRLNLPLDTEVNWDKLRHEFNLASMTLVRDSHQLVPIRQLENSSIYTLSDDSGVFQRSVDQFNRATHWPLAAMELGSDSLLEMLPSTAMVLIDLTSVKDSLDFRKYMARCDRLNKDRAVLIFYSGNPSYVQEDHSAAALLWSPVSTRGDRQLLVELAFGARSLTGGLPGYFYDNGDRPIVRRNAIGRLAYAHPTESKTSKKVLNQIDSLIAQAIAEEMMPGCQVLMVKDGKIEYNKNFGYFTYDSLTAVTWDHLYDIASVTKTVATVPILMSFLEEGRLSLQGQLGDYLASYHKTDKAQLTLDNILTHQSGLKSYIPFWRYAKYFSDSATFLYKEKKWRKKYNYLAVNWSDSIQSWIGDSKYNSLSNHDGTYRYLYSDLGFMVMKEVVEESCSCQLDQSIDHRLFKPLGMNYTTFNPLNKFSREHMAPTEQDRHFRSTLLQGVVHDKNAALLNGVSGHAGLFSNAHDLAKYMQMILQGGYYGGKRYYSDSTIQIFTSKKNNNDRRAMGWDKPDMSVGNASKYASDVSFGHSGFTGTLVWADPKYDLIYIFLSNRIYPDPQNYKLIESNTRTKIHDLMYESFLKLDLETNQDI